MLVISDSAAKKIKSIIDEEDSSLKLRIFVEGGGCSGFQYGFTLEENPPAEDDFTFEKDGIQVVVDVMSMQYLNEAEIDYEQSLLGAEFKIKNPNVKATCGCGSSFTV
jgi:iron-sulfur cluster insertion protein